MSSITLQNYHAIDNLIPLYNINAFLKDRITGGNITLKTSVLTLDNIVVCEGLSLVVWNIFHSSIENVGDLRGAFLQNLPIYVSSEYSKTFLINPNMHEVFLQHCSMKCINGKYPIN